jgi:hypothetical protein
MRFGRLATEDCGGRVLAWGEKKTKSAAKEAMARQFLCTAQI